MKGDGNRVAFWGMRPAQQQESDPWRRGNNAKLKATILGVWRKAEKLDNSFRVADGFFGGIAEGTTVRPQLFLKKCSNPRERSSAWVKKTEHQLSAGEEDDFGNLDPAFWGFEFQKNGLGEGGVLGVVGKDEERDHRCEGDLVATFGIGCGDSCFTLLSSELDLDADPRDGALEKVSDFPEDSSGLFGGRGGRALGGYGGGGE